MCGGYYEEDFDARHDEIAKISDRIERMQELQVPHFIIDREKRKLVDLKEEMESDNVWGAHSRLRRQR